MRYILEITKQSLMVDFVYTGLFFVALVFLAAMTSGLINKSS